MEATHNPVGMPDEPVVPSLDLPEEDEGEKYEGGPIPEVTPDAEPVVETTEE